jgi:hypothetical protein
MGNHQTMLRDFNLNEVLLADIEGEREKHKKYATRAHSHHRYDDDDGRRRK